MVKRKVVSVTTIRSSGSLRAQYTFKRCLHDLVVISLGRHRHHLPADQLDPLVLVEDAGRDHLLQFGHGEGPAPGQALGRSRGLGEGLVHSPRIGSHAADIQSLTHPPPPLLRRRSGVDAAVRAGSVTASARFGKASVLCGMAMAATKCSWKRGSSAVSTLTMRRTTSAISRRDASVEEGDARAGAGGVAGGADMVERAVGDQAEDHRVFHVDVAAEGAGEHDAVDAVDRVVVHEQADAGIERRLGELDGADVGLGDRDARRAVADDIGEGAALGDDSRRARGERAVDDAVGGNDAGEKELRHRLDDAGAADAGDAGRGHGGVEARLVRPEVRADDSVARLEG